MNGSEFLDVVRKLIGEEATARAASKFANLDESCFEHDITGMEALAFYVYTTALEYYQYINAQLWSGTPSPAVIQFAQVLNSGLRKLPAYRLKGGLVYRGYNATNIEAFRERYRVGTIVVFPAFTSASFEASAAFGGNVLFIIRSLNARVIWFLAADYTEYEVLLPTECRFEVIDVRAEERLVVVLQELEL